MTCPASGASLLSCIFSYNLLDMRMASERKKWTQHVGKAFSCREKFMRK